MNSSVFVGWMVIGEMYYGNSYALAMINNDSLSPDFWLIARSKFYRTCSYSLLSENLLEPL